MKFSFLDSFSKKPKAQISLDGFTEKEARLINAVNEGQHKEVEKLLSTEKGPLLTLSERAAFEALEIALERKDKKTINHLTHNLSENFPARLLELFDQHGKQYDLLRKCAAKTDVVVVAGMRVAENKYFAENPQTMPPPSTSGLHWRGVALPGTGPFALKAEGDKSAKQGGGLQPS